MDKKKTLILYYVADIGNLEFFLERKPAPTAHTTILISNSSLPKITLNSTTFVYVNPDITGDIDAYNRTLFLPSSVLFQQTIVETTVSSDGPYLYTLYDKFIFINSILRGPYIPKYCDDWIDCFTMPLSTKVKLVSTSIEPLTIVNSTIKQRVITDIQTNYGLEIKEFVSFNTKAFAIDQECLQLLITNQIFKKTGISADRWSTYILALTIASLLLGNEHYLYSHLINQKQYPPIDGKVFGSSKDKHCLYETIFYMPGSSIYENLERQY